MHPIIKKTKDDAILLIVITSFCCALLLSLLFFLNAPKDNMVYKNVDATYHTLLTARAYQETPVTVHKFLPIISLGEARDKEIPWGATVPDAEGNYYYTSFSPAHFFSYYLFTKVTGSDISKTSLYVFNCLLLFFSVMFSIVMFNQIFRKRLPLWMIILFISILYAFQIEVMHSQGAIYWAQSLMQPFLLVQFIVTINYRKKGRFIILLFLSLCMPYIEWTGVVSNFGCAAYILLEEIKERKDKEPSFFRRTFAATLKPILIGVATLASLALFVTHFLLVIDGSLLRQALLARFLSRSFASTNATYRELIRGFFISYQSLIVVLVCGVIACLLFGKTRKIFLANLRKDWVICILITIPIFENLLMKNHAVNYTFDRLKIIFVLLYFSLVILSAILRVSENIAPILISCAVLFIMTIYNVYWYISPNQYILPTNHMKNNQVIADFISTNFAESTLVQKPGVRGYTNLLFGRGVYEGKTIEDILEENKNLSRYNIELNVEGYFESNVYAYDSVKVYDCETGKMSFFVLTEGKIVEQK